MAELKGWGTWLRGLYVAFPVAKLDRHQIPGTTPYVCRCLYWKCIHMLHAWIIHTYHTLPHRHIDMLVVMNCRAMTYYGISILLCALAS